MNPTVAVLAFAKDPVQGWVFEVGFTLLKLGSIRGYVAFRFVGLSLLDEAPDVSYVH